MITGHPDDPRPVNSALLAWDLLAGAYAAFALLSAERDRQASGKGREVRLALSDLTAATLGNLGNVAEVSLGGKDRPRSGKNLFGAFGRDFVTADGVRVMIVAITPRQWSGMLKALGVDAAISVHQAELGADFSADEGARFIHRGRVDTLIEQAIMGMSLAQAGPIFDACGMTWSVYPTPGSDARLPADERNAPAPPARIGQHTDQALVELLGLGSGEICKLHDAGLVG